MPSERPLNPRHEQTRAALRLIGLLLTGFGLLLTVVGLWSFFASIGTFEPPRYFWCVFPGLPLLGLGLMLTKVGFLGVIYRYMAGEAAPVARDTFNYLAEGTQEGVRTVAQAVGQGLAEGGLGTPSPGAMVRCHKCNAENAAASKFCNKCGTALLKTKACPRCQELNDPDARFCDHCSTPFSGPAPGETSPSGQG